MSTGIYADKTIHIEYQKTMLVISTENGAVLSKWEDVSYIRGCVAGDLLFGVGFLGREEVTAYDRYSGAALWNSQLPYKYAQVHGVRACHDQVFIIDGEGRVHAFQWDEPYVSPVDIDTNQSWLQKLKGILPD